MHSSATCERRHGSALVLRIRPLRGLRGSTSRANEKRTVITVSVRPIPRVEHPAVTLIQDQGRQVGLVEDRRVSDLTNRQIRHRPLAGLIAAMRAKHRGWQIGVIRGREATHTANQPESLVAVAHRNPSGDPAPGTARIARRGFAHNCRQLPPPHSRVVDSRIASAPAAPRVTPGNSGAAWSTTLNPIHGGSRIPFPGLPATRRLPVWNADHRDAPETLLREAKTVFLAHA